MIRSILVVIYLMLFVLFVGVPFIIYAALSGSVDPLYRASVRGLKGMLWLGGVRVRVEGLENVPRGVCIFVANHTSNSDPPAIVVAIPKRVSLLAKKEVFRLPILATAFRLAGLVPVDRGDRDAAAASVDRAVQALKSGLSFLVYPEGTRSPDGRLLPFKKGTFVMAIEAGVPVVPVSVVGAHKVMRKGEWAIHPGEIVVKFQPPVDASQYTLEQRGELLERVQAAVAAGLPEDQQPAAVAKESASA
jgi:1-acyl-sn-glycerol-3-phosphate acyltransferase